MSGMLQLLVRLFENGKVKTVLLSISETLSSSKHLNRMLPHFYSSAVFNFFPLEQCDWWLSGCLRVVCLDMTVTPLTGFQHCFYSKKTFVLGSKHPYPKGNILDKFPYNHNREGKKQKQIITFKIRKNLIFLVSEAI